MCRGSNNLLPLVVWLEALQSLCNRWCNCSQGVCVCVLGGTTGRGSEQFTAAWHKLLYRRLKKGEVCWGQCFATALHIGNQTSLLVFWCCMIREGITECLSPSSPPSLSATLCLWPSPRQQIFKAPISVVSACPHSGFCPPAVTERSCFSGVGLGCLWHRI